MPSKPTTMFVNKTVHRQGQFGTTCRKAEENGYQCQAAVGRWLVEGRRIGGRTGLKSDNKKDPLISESFFVVVWAGIEPATQGFSVLCSTD